ncbi:MAG: hypothetical protein ABIL06_25370, partial [Pseudomonadota bacterium]
DRNEGVLPKICQTFCLDFFLVLLFLSEPLDALKVSRPLQNAPFWPISASDSNFNPRNIQYIPVVEILAFLDLDQN